MRRFVAPLAAVLGVLAMWPAPAAAWAPEAHRAIALIAEELLQHGAPAALKQLQAILATDKGDRLTNTDIASEAIWADVLRDKSPEARFATTPWHAVRIKPDKPDLAAACFGHKPLPAGYPASHGPQDNCSVDKIEQFEKELQESATTPHEKLAAVQFLLNLVADLSDPLLAIDHGDQGGECVAVQIGAHPPVRLATFWEGTLARQVVGANPAAGARRIVAAIPAAQSQKWAAGTPAQWAQDSFETAKNVVYGFSGEPAGQHTFPAAKGQTGGCAAVPLYKVGTDYETKALAAMKEQLAKGGVRLARVLADSLK